VCLYRRKNRSLKMGPVQILERRLKVALQSEEQIKFENALYHSVRGFRVLSRNVNTRTCKQTAVARVALYGPRHCGKGVWEHLRGGCTELHNEELHTLYSSQNTVNLMK
jgi:hypothetical protein